MRAASMLAMCLVVFGYLCAFRGHPAENGVTPKAIQSDASRHEKPLLPRVMPRNPTAQQIEDVWGSQFITSLDDLSGAIIKSNTGKEFLLETATLGITRDGYLGLAKFKGTDIDRNTIAFDHSGNFQSLITSALGLSGFLFGDKDGLNDFLVEEARLRITPEGYLDVVILHAGSITDGHRFQYVFGVTCCGPTSTQGCRLSDCSAKTCGAQPDCLCSGSGNCTYFFHGQCSGPCGGMQCGAGTCQGSYPNFCGCLPIPP